MIHWPDPYLAIAEVLILVMVPILVLLMMAIHECAPALAKPSTRVALGWMVATAAFTFTVHFVELTVTLPGYNYIFDFKWPSTFYAIDIAAWDVFFGLSLLFAVPAFTRPSDALVRKGFIASSSLCLIGLIGPFANVLGWRTIGILGYTIVSGSSAYHSAERSRIARHICLIEYPRGLLRCSVASLAGC